MTVQNLLRTPSALVPMALSAAALVLVLGYVALVGVDLNPQGDEGTPARIFQLLVAGQFTGMVVFAIRWLPASPRAALVVLALQVVSVALPIATVVVLEN